jgi:DegV family protein with EDD domain
MDLDNFYAHLREMVDNIPTSSQPSQHALEDLLESYAQAGDEVLGIWLGSSFSGTYDGALRAARAVESRNIGFRYIMIDSQSAGFDEGFPVLAAARAVNEGATLVDAAQAVLHTISSSRILFAPENLTFLQKGGRIGGAAALLGNLMRIAPVLTVRNGTAQVASKVRSQKKALARMVEIMEEDIAKGGGLKQAVVHYIGDKTSALEWAKNVIEPLLKCKVRVIPVSPVLGLHVGPAVGLAYECNKPLENKYTGNLQSLLCAS